MGDPLQRPPYPRSDGIQLAVAYMLIVPLAVAPFALLILGVSVARAGWSTALRVIGVLVVLVPFVIVGRGLAGRRRWSRRCALALCGVVTLGMTAGAIAPFVWPPENGHGVMYVVMGGIMWSAFGLGVIVSLLRTRPEAFIPSPAAWLADPAREARFRFWDGRRWTDQVAPQLPDCLLLNAPLLAPGRSWFASA